MGGVHQARDRPHLPVGRGVRAQQIGWVFLSAQPAIKIGAGQDQRTGEYGSRSRDRRYGGFTRLEIGHVIGLLTLAYPILVTPRREEPRRVHMVRVDRPAKTRKAHRARSLSVARRRSLLNDVVAGTGRVMGCFRRRNARQWVPVFQYAVGRKEPHCRSPQIGISSVAETPLIWPALFHFSGRTRSTRLCKSGQRTGTASAIRRANSPRARSRQSSESAFQNCRL
jgi:hypothetical protein